MVSKKEPEKYILVAVSSGDEEYEEDGIHIKAYVPKALTSRFYVVDLEELQK